MAPADCRPFVESGADLSFRAARPVIGEGERAVYQGFDICLSIPRPHRLWQLTHAVEELIAAALGPEGDWRHSQNGFALAIDIAAFTEPARYRRDIDALVDALKALPPARGNDEVRVPGERGGRVMAERMETGVPLPAGTWNRLAEVASGLGVAMPAVIAG